MQKRLRELRVLKNKIVLITGGSSGIGEATAYEAAKRGAIVVVCARHLDQLELVAKRCLILSGRPAFAYQLDVADPDQIDDVLETINHEVGSVDILVNAAGFGDMQADVKETLPTMDKMVRVNLLALMYISRCTAKQMMSKGRGVIINIGSIAGKIPTPNSGVYSATKAGVINYDNVLRMELYDYGIQVITVNPGPVDTHFFDKADPKGNYISHLPSAIVLHPAVIARRIWNSVGYPVREINIPRFFSAVSIGYQLFPGIGDWVIKKFFAFK
ncbi:short-chain dehydrogenase [Paucilactobacillus hokkaidonensis JCM 18461]|uniref:Short-chain dehydrogenase n=2 Tax=Paucilactobacillus hokkaidonensis TaxID=1193095 RepID=A0A0A1GY72_9LACO|nr:SDR family NAD(P)-dependent oxidoreductase [Paucilactobacillus hokkaidonensis]KRO08904.1 short-chain dehydrogenase reductase SDR [Paucilactobacillus hokkaidonensis]BAP85849.1 short-chain dehydrogenase [Paucilactobacillus hokkaidonensis JCM 18461]